MKFYVTAAIPYVNAAPHLGHALEFVLSDVIARYHRQLGDKVFYVTGADENSLKIVQAAEKEGITAQQLADKYSKIFQETLSRYQISLDKFQRTSSPEHMASSQELWKLCDKNGDIYKKKYRGLYCVGCEQFYTRDELNEKGECYEHPGKPLEEVEEENYFFRLSKYQADIEKLIESGKYKIAPEHRKNEALAFIKQGLQDFSISRSKERAHSWGVSVPGDDNQIMYVWFDALNVYRSAALDWWPADLHVIGKGVMRFHAIYWPAILLSAKLPLPKELFVHGYITVNGQKMSKSIGNVIDPVALVKKYGSDSVRYYLLREIPTDGDGDFSEEKFKLRYNADLANGLGNFAARVLTLARGKNYESGIMNQELENLINKTKKEVAGKIEARKLHEALAVIWHLLKIGDEQVNEKKPWEAKPEELKKIMPDFLAILSAVADLLKPFLPETAEKLEQAISKNKKPVLFPRI